MLSRGTQEQDPKSFQDKYIPQIPYIHHVVLLGKKIVYKIFCSSELRYIFYPYINVFIYLIIYHTAMQKKKSTCFLHSSYTKNNVYLK